MNFRDRIIGFERIPASQIQANPVNPRQHSESQQRAMTELVNRLGFAGALLVYRTDDGGYQLIDGELRQNLAGDQPVPVLITDLTPDEARELLLFFDRVSGMASYRPDVTLELIEQLDVDTKALADLADEMAAEAQIEGMASTLDGDTGGGREQPGGRQKRHEEKSAAPIKAVISTVELQLVEKALAATHVKNRGEALAILAQAYLNAIGES